MSHFKIIWTNRAISSIEQVFEFYENKSLSYAKKIRQKLFESPESIHFPHQYQVDSVNSKYRRIVVENFKVLYSVQNNTIFIHNIVCTKQEPNY